MTVQTKSSMILLSTLLLGILIGALGMNFYKNQRHVQFKDFRERRMFMGLHERIIQPTSDSQRDSITQVLDKYLPSLKAIQVANRQDLENILDSLQNDLKPILTDEQWQRLIERRERMDRMRPDEFGPPPGDMPFPNRPEDGNRPGKRRPFPDDKPPHEGDRMPPPPPSPDNNPGEPIE